MSDKAQFLNTTRAFPDSQTVTFDGQKTTLGELRKGSGTSFSSPSASGAGTSVGACPKCKSLSTVNVKDGKACNACGHVWGGAR